MSTLIDRLSQLTKTKAEIEAEIVAEQAVAVRAERERKRAEQSVAEAVEQSGRDATRYTQTNELVQKIMVAVGKGIKDPNLPIILHLLGGSMDALSSYYRHYNSNLRKQ